MARWTEGSGAGSYRYGETTACSEVRSCPGCRQWHSLEVPLGGLLAHSGADGIGR
jgi:hypothetical protein